VTLPATLAAEAVDQGFDYAKLEPAVAGKASAVAARIHARMK
jgi:hypothetical protein